MKILVVNSGSSSLKYQLLQSDSEEALARGVVERIGTDQATVHQKALGFPPYEVTKEISNHTEALKIALSTLLQPNGPLEDIHEIDAVGHRVVHGGERFSQSVLLDSESIDLIEQLNPLAPLHNPHNLAGIRACLESLPETPQVAVFDTAFHSTLSSVAYRYAIPEELYSSYGIRRYGFHGTSHKYVAQKAIQYLDDAGKPSERIITCHLGNGGSITAVLGGKSVDTSMGMTPSEGLIMGTRSGDCDPGIFPYLVGNLGWDAKQIDTMINRKGGLLALSGKSNDMRDITDAAADGDIDCQLALDAFCYRIRKYIGAYMAALGGLDGLVFTGGIGENSDVVRRLCCQGLEFAGVVLSDKPAGKIETLGVISASDSKVMVMVVPTNEELMIARETAGLIEKTPVGAA